MSVGHQVGEVGGLQAWAATNSDTWIGPVTRWQFKAVSKINIHQVFQHMYLFTCHCQSMSITSKKVNPVLCCVCDGYNLVTEGTCFVLFVQNISRLFTLVWSTNYAFSRLLAPFWFLFCTFFVQNGTFSPFQKGKGVPFASVVILFSAKLWLQTKFAKYKHRTSCIRRDLEIQKVNPFTF